MTWLFLKFLGKLLFSHDFNFPSPSCGIFVLAVPRGERMVKWSKKQLGCSRQGSYFHMWLRVPGHELWATNFQGAKQGALRLPFPFPPSSKIEGDWKEDPGSLASPCLLQHICHGALRDPALGRSSRMLRKLGSPCKTSLLRPLLGGPTIA